MTEIQIDRLASGEPACGINKVVYALFKHKADFVVRTTYNGEGKPVSSLSADDFPAYGGELLVSDQDFTAFLVTRKLHREQLAALGRVLESSRTSTPWGQADQVVRYTRGLNSYCTPRHGGFKVSEALNMSIPEMLRNADGWYEEDSEWAKVAFALPQHFTDHEIQKAHENLINYYPNEYEALTGKVIEEGQSSTRDETLFHTRNAGNWVAISAINSDEEEGMVLVTATMDGQRERHDGPSVEEKRFLVPNEEYRSRSRFGFVVDPDKHRELDDMPKPGR